MDVLVRCQLDAPVPDLVWLTDITKQPGSGCNIYLCPIKEVFTNWIGGYVIYLRDTAEFACSALPRAIARFELQGTVLVHSDRDIRF